MGDPRLRYFTICLAVFVLALYSCSCGFFFALFISSVHPAFYPELYPGLCPETPDQGPTPTLTAWLPELSPTPILYPEPPGEESPPPPTTIPTAEPTLPPTWPPTPTIPATATPTPTIPPYPEPYPGPPGEGPSPTPTEPACDCAGPDLDCEIDFTIQTEAQACFDYCQSLGYGDTFGLDDDGDGLACESLP